MQNSLSVIKNTSVLLVGRIVTIALGIVYFGALSRYAQPSGFGMIATATAMISLSSLLLNFGLDDVTVRDVAVDKGRMVSYLPNLFFLRGVLVIIFLIVILAITKWVHYPPATTTIIYIYSFSYILDELTAIFFSIFTAYERMEFPAALQTGRDLLNFCLSLLAISLHASLYVIVGISVFASLIKFIASLMLLRWKFSLPSLKIDLKLSRKLFVTALPFAALLSISVLTQNVSTFILSIFSPAQQVGWYNSASILVNYLLLLPAILVQAIFPVFSKLYAASLEELRRVYSTVFKLLLILGFAFCFGTIVIADPVVFLIYGPGFEQAASTLRVLALVLFWMFGYANGSMLNATGGQGISTKIGVIGIIILIGASIALTPRFGPLGAALARILPGALFFIPLTVICHRRLDLAPPFGSMLKTLVAALIMAATASFALTHQLSLLLVILLVAPGIYVLVLMFLGVLSRSDYQLAMRVIREGKLKSRRGPITPPEHTQEI